ncbi:MAG: hypothetical protein ACPG19_12690 [Saprospiraceae bacterium]
MTYTTNKKYRNRQIRFLIVTIISLILTIGSLIHDYYEEEEEYPRTEGFIDVNDFWGTHILTRKTLDCADTSYNRVEEITIDWDMYSEELMFGYTDKYQECNSNWDKFRFYGRNCFLEKKIQKNVKSTIHQLVLMKNDSTSETAPFRYEYSLQVVGNIESFTWQSSRTWTEFDVFIQRIRYSCSNMSVSDLY